MLIVSSLIRFPFYKSRQRVAKYSECIILKGMKKPIVFLLLKSVLAIKVIAKRAESILNCLVVCVPK